MIAAQYGAPVIMATGDDAAMAELAPSIPGAERVAVKTALGFHAAETLAPSRAQEMIRAAAHRSVQRIGEIRPGKAPAPVNIELTFHFYRPAELLAYLPGVERTGARSIRFKAPDMAAAARMVTFILDYSVELQP
jgi:D-amino peptidase